MDQLQMQVPGATINTGITTIDFGAFPGASDSSVVITGQTGITSGSVVSAWLVGIDTADHSADEHTVESIAVKVGSIVAGTGFTISAINTNNLFEPLEWVGSKGDPTKSSPPIVQGFQRSTKGSIGTTIYGLWSVAWMWI